MVRLVSFRTLGAAGKQINRVGALIGSNLQPNSQILDFTAISASARPFKDEQVGDMVSFIATGDDGVAWAREEVQKAQNGKLSSAVTTLDKVKLLAPIPVPRRNIVCVGKNYKDHIAEVAAADKERGIGTTSAPTPELPKYPQFFTKAPTTVVAPHDAIESHSEITKWLDYEAEMAVIIGKGGRDLTAENALDHVYGYAIANDVTARDVQRRHNQWFKGKSLDSTCPLGPVLVHKSLVPNPHDLTVKLWLNGTLRQDGHTSNMIFSITELLVHLSSGFTLWPGDILLTGTPEGVGYARKPPIVLQRGDRVAIEIGNLGRLENPVH